MGGVFLLGVAGFVLRLQDGLGDHTRWGYLAAAFAFLLTTAMSAPMVAIAPRLARAHWHKPLTRAAELWAVVGLLLVLMSIPLLMALPSASGRNSIWFVGAVREGWPPGAPHAWLFLAVLFLTICGLGLLWAGAIPDLATARDHGPQRWRNLYARLALGWRGSVAQWRMQRTFVSVLSAFYFMFLVFVQTIVAADLAMGLVPGWKDAIFPAFHALSGFQSAVALAVLTAFVLRLTGFRDYLGIDQFWGLAKLLLALSLLWFYFWWSTFITYWYGRTPAEQNVLLLFMFQSYRPVFILTLVLNFVLPFFLLIWNGIRKSILGPTLVAASVLVGTFFDRIRLYVASFSIADSSGHALEQVPPARLPDVADVLMLVGAVAGAVALYLLATRLVPVLSIWETKEWLLLQRVRRLLKLEMKVVAKPE